MSQGTKASGKALLGAFPFLWLIVGVLQKLDFPEAELYLQGAHLTRFRDWLFLSSRAKFEIGKAIRGGIPVVFPWFGPNADDASAPQHGWARTALWSVESQEDDRVSLCLDSLHMNPAGGAWPFNVRLEYTFGEALEARFTVQNLGAGPTKFECALHTYFAVSDVEGVTIEGLDGLTYRDKTQNNERFTQSGVVSFAGEVDRAYFHAPSTLRLRDGESGFELSGNWKSAVTWNPGAEKAAAMSDMDEGEWRKFACLEVGVIADNAVTLGAGETWALEVQIRRL